MPRAASQSASRHRCGQRVGRPRTGELALVTGLRRHRPHLWNCHLSDNMFFLPRQTPLISLAIVTGLILALFFGPEEVAYALSGVLFVFLALAVLLDLYEPPKR